MAHYSLPQVVSWEMQVTNIVCKVDVELAVKSQHCAKYRGNTIALSKSGLTLFLTQNQEEIICQGNFGEDLSDFLTQEFGKTVRGKQ